ncbi:MAG TPA: NAD-dependent epimerase/dehydratase family protein [Thermoleophilaceae bacterium]
MRAGRVVVTGCAGFIGSHLCERLVAQGCEVVGVDCFTNYYARERKEQNLALLRDAPSFALIEADLARSPLDGLLEGVDTVFHLAAQAGVRGSFGESFRDYVAANVLATQRLLEEAARTAVGAFVYASSSSVYGDAPAYPTPEESERRPVSPYGMTKVATEELAGVYNRCFGVPVVGLRYFTAYGPRQRPDMAFSRFLRCALDATPLPLNGDGRQVRDFTFVDDVVDATVAAARLGRVGAVYNVGGGSPVAVIDAIRLIGELVGRRIDVAQLPAPLGDPRRTGCDPSLAMAELGFVPRTPLRDGLSAQLEWMLAEHEAPAAPLAVAGSRG